jgi:hypothetical protein
MQIHSDHVDEMPFLLQERLFSEIPSSAIVSAKHEQRAAIDAVLNKHPRLWLSELGTVTDGQYRIAINGSAVIDLPTSSLQTVFADSLEAKLVEEVLV